MVSYVVGFALLLLVAGGGYYVANKTVSTAPSEDVVAEAVVDDSSQAASANRPTNPNATTVTYTDKGFGPDAVTIKLGQTVRWFNQSSGKLWVAANPHPTHTSLAGFDENGSINKGQGWQYTFTQVGTFSYHNHMMPGKSEGKVVVQAK